MGVKRLLMLFGIAIAFSFVTGGIVVRVLGDRNRCIAIKDALLGTGEVRQVEVAGRLDPIGPNRFILRDKTGMIVLETCPTWYRAVKARRSESVHAVGTVTIGRGLSGARRTYFEVYRFIWPDGRETVIRPSWGKPPWAYSAAAPTNVHGRERLGF